MRVKTFIKLISYAMGVAFYSFSPVQAGTVESLKGAKVIFDFNGEAAPNPGDKYFILDSHSNKEIGLVQVLKIKGARALAKLIKGRGRAGDATELAQEKVERHRRKESEESSESAMIRPQNRNDHQGAGIKVYGVGIDLTMTSRYLNLPSVGSGSFAGNAIGYRFVVDYPLAPPWVLLGSVGIHPFSVSGTASLDSTSFAYKESHSYLAIEALGRYLLEGRTTGVWIGGGLGLYLPSSSSSTLSSEKAKTEILPIGSVGYNMKYGPKFVTFKADVVNFPSKSSGLDLTKQTFQLVLGAIYFL